MWNPFKKKQASNDPNQMGFLQKLAMKKFMSMSPEQKEKVAKEMMKPENIAKNRDKILQAMEQMKASGMVNQAQIEEAKRRFGL